MIDYAKNMYEGMFMNGKKEGQGTYKYSNGNIFKGNWANGNRHGKGTFKYFDGTSRIINYVNGEEIGMSVKIFPG